MGHVLSLFLCPYYTLPRPAAQVLVRILPPVYNAGIPKFEVNRLCVPILTIPRGWCG